MRKLWTRWIALLLIPCLIADPIASAIASPNLLPAVMPTSRLRGGPSCFTSEAFEPPLDGARFLGASGNFAKGQISKVFSGLSKQGLKIKILGVDSHFHWTSGLTGLATAAVFASVWSQAFGPILAWIVAIPCGVAFMVLLFWPREYARSREMSRSGSGRTEIFISGFGGMTVPERPTQEPADLFRSTFHALATSFVVGSLFWILPYPLHNIPQPFHVFYSYLRRMGMSNFIFGAYNLFPLFPLDGGNLLRAAFLTRFKNSQATAMAVRITQVSTAVWVLTEVFSLHFHPSLPAIVLMSAVSLRLLRLSVQTIRRAAQEGVHVSWLPDTVRAFHSDESAELRFPRDAAEKLTLSPGLRRILVVNEDEWSRKHIVDQLESLGYAVQTAADSNEALHLLAVQKPDLVITSIYIIKKRIAVASPPFFDELTNTPLLIRQLYPQLPMLICDGLVGSDRTAREYQMGFLPSASPSDVIEKIVQKALEPIPRPIKAEATRHDFLNDLAAAAGAAGMTVSWPTAIPSWLDEPAMNMESLQQLPYPALQILTPEGRAVKNSLIKDLLQAPLWAWSIFYQGETERGQRGLATVLYHEEMKGRLLRRGADAFLNYISGRTLDVGELNSVLSQKISEALQERISLAEDDVEGVLVPILHSLYAQALLLRTQRSLEKPSVLGSPDPATPLTGDSPTEIIRETIVREYHGGQPVKGYVIAPAQRNNTWPLDKFLQIFPDVEGFVLVDPEYETSPKADSLEYNPWILKGLAEAFSANGFKLSSKTRSQLLDSPLIGKGGYTFTAKWHGRPKIIHLLPLDYLNPDLRNEWARFSPDGFSAAIIDNPGGLSRAGDKGDRFYSQILSDLRAGGFVYASMVENPQRCSTARSHLRRIVPTLDPEMDSAPWISSDQFVVYADQRQARPSSANSGSSKPAALPAGQAGAPTASAKSNDIDPLQIINQSAWNVSRGQLVETLSRLARVTKGRTLGVVILGSEGTRRVLTPADPPGPRAWSEAVRQELGGLVLDNRFEGAYDIYSWRLRNAPRNTSQYFAIVALPRGPGAQIDRVNSAMQGLIPAGVSLRMNSPAAAGIEQVAPEVLKLLAVYPWQIFTPKVVTEMMGKNASEGPTVKAALESLAKLGRIQAWSGGMMKGRPIVYSAEDNNKILAAVYAYKHWSERPDPNDLEIWNRLSQQEWKSIPRLRLELADFSSVSTKVLRRVERWVELQRTEVRFHKGFIQYKIPGATPSDHPAAAPESQPGHSPVNRPNQKHRNGRPDPHYSFLPPIHPYLSDEAYMPDGDEEGLGGVESFDIAQYHRRHSKSSPSRKLSRMPLRAA